ncbi:arginyl-tRNA synthetase [Babesia gibsoni]|uniref:arginine--tRNA ligase n=1 Tax=Babesia gibsoni TaxID=33632 RepID=A0AAD8LPS9_BABGI|nr:arginyl-tRNA synthetase [Babesia gibsoni]
MPSIFLILAAFALEVSCVKRGYSPLMNAMAPHLINTATSFITGSPPADMETPQISLKIVPSKHIHLTPSEMNSLLFSIKQEIHRKELLEHKYENEKHLSAWALNQAPVFMPFRENPKSGKPKHQPTLEMEVNKKEKGAPSMAEATEAVGPSNIIVNQVKDVIRNALSKSISSQLLQGNASNISVVAANPKFGDFQWNDAISLYKSIGSSLPVGSPKELAELVKSNIDSSLFSSVNVSPQGFLTITLSNDFLSREIIDMLKNGVRAPQVNKGFRVAVDFSSPNIAKEMHVGHLRSTVIGDSMARILEFHGYEVLRINHLGDWGTHFGMLVEYMLEKHPDFMTNVPSISDFTQFYKEAKALRDSNEDFMKRSRKRVVMLQSGEEVSRKVWKMLCEISEREFSKIYKLLDIKLESCGESFYNNMIPEVVKELQEKKLIVESEGAQCLFTSLNDVPLMAIKSDGSYGYDSTDLACINYRINQLNCKWIIYVTDVGQRDHFLKIFDAAQQAGWTKGKDYEVRLDHLGFGTVQDSSGNKFKTRSGDTVKLITLLDEAVSRATAELESRIKARLEEGEPEVDINVEEVSKCLGYGAVKYFDLKHGIINNYKFSFDSMLDPKGNTAVYLLYAYARICQIFQKAGIDGASIDPAELTLSHASEIALAKRILKLPEVLHQITQDFSINKLAEFLYALSVDFSAFYKQCRVIGDPNEESRLALCQATKSVMKTAFQLLGINPADRI